MALAYERSTRYQRLVEAYNETRRALEETTGDMFGLVSKARGMRQVLRMAEKLRAERGPRQTGGPAFVLGAMAAYEADTHWDKNRLTYHISYCGLSGPATAAHFHNAPIGANGPVVFPLVPGNPITGVWVAELEDGLPSQGETTTYTDTLVAGNSSRLFYRIREQ